MTPLVYLIGLTAAVLSAVCAGFWLGRRERREKVGVTPSAADGGSSPKVELRDDETQLRKEKQLQRDFEIISGYNLYQALERRSDR